MLTERDFGWATDKPLEEGFVALDAGEVLDAEPLECVAERMRKALALFAALPGEGILACGSSGAERMMRAVYEDKGFFDVEPLHNGQIREYVI